MTLYSYNWPNFPEKSSRTFYSPLNLPHFLWPLVFLFSLSVHANWLHSCPTLCNAMDCSLPSSSVCRILQARILEWVVIYCRGDLSRWGYKSEILEFIMKESVTFIRRHSPFLRRICRPSPVLLDSWSPPGRHSSVGSSASLTEVLTFREVPLGRCACSVLQRVLLFLPAV